VAAGLQGGAGAEALQGAQPQRSSVAAALDAFALLERQLAAREEAARGEQQAAPRPAGGGRADGQGPQ
jgi:hypothetical protein